MVRSVYHEISEDAPQGILLDDSGTLSVDATRFSYKTSGDKPLMELSNFKGDLALLTDMLLPVNSEQSGRISIHGDGSRCNALCMANLFIECVPDVAADKVWTDQSTPPAAAAMLLCNINYVPDARKYKGKKAFDFLADRGKPADQWILRMLEPLRQTRIWLPQPAADGATDIRVHRVIAASGKDGVGMELRAAKE